LDEFNKLEEQERVEEERKKCLNTQEEDNLTLEDDIEAFPPLI
jgi:hypothetical protein